MLTERNSLTLNLSTLQLHGSIAHIDVTDAECQLLGYLAQASGKRIDASSLLVQLGLPTDENGKNALSVRVVRLRKKLLAAGACDPTIKSIRGKGYQLCVLIQIT